MLHSENRKSGKKGYCSLIALFSSALLFIDCSTDAPHKNRQITMEAFSDMKTPAFVINPQLIDQNLSQLLANDRQQTEADKQMRACYNGQLLWVDKYGVDEKADTLLNWLRKVGEIGLTERSFGVSQIEKDLERMRTLAFDDANPINLVIARLDYQLTKACLRYCYGQRFGFVNPHRVFNHLDVEKQDSARKITQFRGLFDVAMDLPTSQFAVDVLRKVKNDSLTALLHEIQPTDANYLYLKQQLPKDTSLAHRRRIVANMERCRWRRHEPIATTGKRIIVNIPAFHLYAYNEGELLDMRVVCGARTTKTPQLTSKIEWMEVNPQWVIPMSIIKKEVSSRAGDSAYFARHRYDIVNKETQQVVNPANVSRQMLLSGNYRVAQKGGAGNSLGRIVFRFKNRYSVYLHDTSTPSAFQRDVRSLSHGCVRVSKPFELANFVLDNPDEWLLDRIRIGMGQQAQTDQGRQWLRAHPDKDDLKKLIGYVGVKPHVPLYIIYNTMWPDENGVWREWPDVYGYDDVIWKQMQPYMQ